MQSPQLKIPFFFYFGLLLFISNGIASEQNPSTILKLDTFGHTANIQDLLISKDKEIISASADKTIRIWDSRTGEEKRKILGEIGKNGEGTIFAIALSADNRYLAVGGFFAKGYGVDDDKVGNIRIYEYSSGRLIKILKSHQNIVNDLNFSSDDLYLVSGSGDNSVKLWETKKWTLQATINKHSNHVYAVLMLKKPKGGYDIYSAAYDNKLTLHHFKKKVKFVKEFKAPFKLQYLASNGKQVSVSGDGKKVFIFNRNLKPLKTINNNSHLGSLAYSPNGQTLVVGTAKPPFNVNSYNLPDYTKLSSFKEHTNLTKAVAFLDDDTVVSGGGENKEIFIWNKNSATTKTKIVSAGRTIWSVGIKGNQLAWGNVYDCGKKNCNKLQTAFNLNTFQRQRNFQDFNRISIKQGKYSLNHSKGGDYGYEDAVLNIQKNGKKVSSITKNSTTGLVHNSYGWMGNFIISGGSNGQLTVYNRAGKKVASLIGHAGDVWSLAVEGSRLVSGSSDHSIKLWDLSALKKAKPPKKFYPLLNLFVSKNNGYVVWTKEGFFDASKDGAKYIGYHLNKGETKAAEFVSLDKFYPHFYRPDLIGKILKKENLGKYAQNMSVENFLKTGLAPNVAFKTKSHLSNDRNILLSLKLCEKGGGYNNITLFLNGVVIDVFPSKSGSSREKKGCFELQYPVSLIDGTNVLSFKATNQKGTIDSNTAQINIDYKELSAVKPTLHILALGVDKYAEDKLQLNYSIADTTGFIEAVTTAAQPLFAKIERYQLSDAEVTKANVLAKFSEIGAKTNRNDVFMFYMTGRGMIDSTTGGYFYIPYDFRLANKNSLREKGIGENDFKLALSKIQALKSLTIIDTSNSEHFSKTQLKQEVLEKMALNKLVRATGRSMIVVNNQSQIALAGYEGHGVLIYTLMEVLNGKDYGADSALSIKELVIHIEDVLPNRTYEKWNYKQVPQTHIMGKDFPIGMKK